MKKIVPFKKEIIFKSNLAEITSISLEHSLHYESDHLITGEFSLSGNYRMSEESINTETFSFDIPFDINMDEKYVLDKAIIDINDFYYEIINSRVLSVNIEVSIDKLEEQPLIIDEPEIELEEQIINIHELEESEDRKEEVKIIDNIIEPVELLKEKNDQSKENNEPSRCVEEETHQDISEVKSLFDNITSDEEYVSYKICIVRDGDSLESIMIKYNVSREDMELYNDLKEIKIGDKLIIPNVKA